MELQAHRGLGWGLARRACGEDAGVNPSARMGVLSSHRHARRRAVSLAAARAIRRPAVNRRTRGGSRLPLAIASLLGVVLLVVSGGLGALGVTAIATVGSLSSDLPDPTRLADLTFAQPTIVYDRTGKVQLGRFEREQRRVVTYDEVPKTVLDATTTAEDRTFWTNDGFDPAAILAAIAENASGASDRGASTITQQLVRARLLPDDVVAPGANRYLRKAKELIQSARLTQAFPGEAGKQQIITAYLNEIYYGHDAYGIAAAARIYFGVTDLSKLTPAQAALLAGLPKSPSSFDPFRFAQPDADGKLVVPEDSPPVVRRDWILQHLGESRWTRLSPAALNAALAEPVVLSPPQPRIFKAPQFTWQVERQLVGILGGVDKLETGGYKVITSLDWNAQQLAEKWVTAAVIAPNLKKSASGKLLKSLKIGKADQVWINRLRGKDVHNAALVAIDYRTGDVVAYVGSAGYYRDDLASAKFDPKFDVAGDGYRQPGSAWKPIVYSTAFEQHDLTPGSLLLDITTQFGKDWTPRDADRLERGPVRVRQALQYSLNIPAIRALERTGNQAVADEARKLGINFPGGGDQRYLQAGLAGAIGTVEIRPLDLTSAYGSLANGGVHVPSRMILQVIGPDGRVVYQAPDAAETANQAMSPQAAWLTTDILAGNTDPKQNPIWSKVVELKNGPKGSRRPAAVKTGTTNDTRDLATYGYVAPPEDPAAPAYAVGIWMGNSDHSQPRAAEAVISLQGPAPLWHAFVRDLTKGTPVAKFARPKGVVQAKIDAWSGGKPGPWTRATVKEWFIDGTQPGAKHEVDPAGILYTRACGQWEVDPVAAELGPKAWDADVADWARRARAGTGRAGSLGSRTAYFWGERSWGGRIIGPCPKPKPKPTPSPSPHPGGGHGGGGGGGGRPRWRDALADPDADHGTRRDADHGSASTTRPSFGACPLAASGSGYPAGGAPIGRLSQPEQPDDGCFLGRRRLGRTLAGGPRATGRHADVARRRPRRGLAARHRRENSRSKPVLEGRPHAAATDESRDQQPARRPDRGQRAGSDRAPRASRTAGPADR